MPSRLRPVSPFSYVGQGRRGQWEIRVFFLESSANEMFKVVWPKGKEISKGDLELLKAKVKAFRAEILEEWERKVLPQ
jgi:hypothetical protein